MIRDSEIAKLREEWSGSAQLSQEKNKRTTKAEVVWVDVVPAHVSKVPFTRFNIFIQIATAFSFLL